MLHESQKSSIGSEPTLGMTDVSDMLSFQAAASPLSRWPLALLQIFLCSRPERGQVSLQLSDLRFGPEYIVFLAQKHDILCYMRVNRHATYDLIPIYETADLPHLSL
jgi:hypothetical protein